MPKEKLNLSLDHEIKEELQIIAEQHHMNVSALITYWVTTQEYAKKKESEKRKTHEV